MIQFLPDIGLVAGGAVLGGILVSEPVAQLIFVIMAKVFGRPVGGNSGNGKGLLTKDAHNELCAKNLEPFKIHIAYIKEQSDKHDKNFEIIHTQLDRIFERLPRQRQ